MLKILQIIPAYQTRKISYSTGSSGESKGWAPVVGYALTNIGGILPIIGWGERGETDIVDPETGNVLIPDQDYEVKGGAVSCRKKR